METAGRFKGAGVPFALETSLVEWKHGMTIASVLRAYILGNFLSGMETSALLETIRPQPPLGNFLSGMETQGARQGALDGPGPWKLP